MGLKGLNRKRGPKPGPRKLKSLQAEKTEPAGGKTKPDIWQIGKVGTPFLCLVEYYP